MFQNIQNIDDTKNLSILDAIPMIMEMHHYQNTKIFHIIVRQIKSTYLQTHVCRCRGRCIHTGQQMQHFQSKTNFQIIKKQIKYIYSLVRE